MKRILLTILVAALGLGMTACGEGKSSVDYETIIQQFADALFAGKLDDAKAMLTESNLTDVSAHVDQFGAIHEKYKFQEILLASCRPGSPSGVNPESDKRAQFTYQFSLKDTEDWAYGWIEIRAVNQDGMWEVTEVKLGRPTK